MSAKIGFGSGYAESFGSRGARVQRRLRKV